MTALAVPRTHFLKCLEPWFLEIMYGRKTFDVRSTAARCFQAGDTLILYCCDPTTASMVLDQEGRVNTISVKILGVYTHLPGLIHGYAVLSLEFVRSRPTAPAELDL